ncbi:peptidase M24, structural domain-containing protein [Cantharellus anzutake]|uniref:peptidase M24, structural domain-containing protein n=1 Tax=Cantharellus anzutake TaxID=1750568 RepID=UPI001908C31D|nr:peptidase M24, structural domain-containing protein [Cantharellus anzutake]KAF8324475.1 peptidase M24, structural domain-containing protein [Cantharellus anzutake]
MSPLTAGSKRRLDSTARLLDLRELMKAEPDGGLDYYIVPSEDAHQSEYTAPSDRRREWISGFTGSAGTCIVSRSEAHAFTDSRYFIQASQELDKNWTLHKVGLPGVKPWQEWIKDRPRGSRIGIDSRLISHEAATALASALNARYSKLVFPRVNLVDKLWKTRPPKPQGQVFTLDRKFAGKTASEKIDEVRTWIKSQRPPQPPVIAKSAAPTTPNAKSPPKQPMNPVAAFLSNLSCIAWLLNIRGHDIEFNPVVMSYLFITTKQSFLFVDKAKLSSEVQAYLKEQGVSVREYADVWSFLRRAEWGDGKVLIDPKTPYAVSLMLTSARYKITPSFVEERKAIKNKTELQGMRNAYIRDGAAMVRWFAWLDEQIKGGAKLTEWEAAEELTKFRQESANYWGLAYENISASGPNAALPHYRTTEEDAAFIDPTLPYLNDSGGQYFDGTCDTTRTVHFGFPTSEQMEAYTRVLQGHIAINQAIFPEGTTGAQLDVLARKALWKDGLHGTGHGIGSFLNVHEGPIGFSSQIPLVPGHVISNEPGFYKEGEFGIRIESALTVTKVTTKGQFGGDVWLGFERLTHVPIQTKMVKMDLLTKEEKAWLKDHNAQCRARLAPLLGDDKRALRWIRRECTKSGPSSAGGMTLDWD